MFGRKSRKVQVVEVPVVLDTRYVCDSDNLPHYIETMDFTNNTQSRSKNYPTRMAADSAAERMRENYALRGIRGVSVQVYKA